jgi:cytochrome P450
MSSAEREAPTVPTTAELGSLADTADVEPWGFYEQVREKGDVVLDERLNAYLVSNYDLLRAMGRADDALWKAAFVPDDENPPFGLTRVEFTWFMAFGSSQNLALLEGEPHDHQHRWWMKAFSPRLLAHWGETLIAPIANEILDDLAPRGRGELCAEFADEVAPRVIAAVMGLPSDREWVSRLLSLQASRLAYKQQQADPSPDPELRRVAFEGTQEMIEMLEPHVMSRRSGEGDDFISMVWRDAPNVFGTDAYEDVDVASVVLMAWEGGSGTTMYSTANGLYILMTHPQLQERLREGGRPAIKGFVEETLRLYGPVVFRPRTAKADTTLDGVPICKGDQVIAMTVSAGTDPGHYSCPYDVDVERPSPRDHFAFGVGGNRVCPGQGLARVELEEIADVVLRRLPNLRLDPEAEPARYRELLMRRWEPLWSLWG